MDTNKIPNKLGVLPPIKINSISPRKRDYMNLKQVDHKNSKKIKPIKSELIKSINHNHFNKNLFVKLNSITFLNEMLYENRNLNHVNNKNNYSSKVKKRFNTSFDIEKSLLIPNLKDSDLFKKNNEKKSVEIKINFKNKYELISVLKQDGLFSTQTCIIMSSSSFSLNNNNTNNNNNNNNNEQNMKYLMKKLDLTESTNKNGITKKQIDEYEYLLNNYFNISNLNLTNIKESYLSNDMKSFYIVREYCDDTFEQLLKNSYKNQEFFDLNSILTWFNQTLSAINYLHKKCNILHSNLKPSNFLIKNNILKLSDFGYLNINTRFKYLLKLVNNAENKLYLPMETVRNYKYSFKSDMYAIGSIFYEILLLENYDFLKEDKKEKVKTRIENNKYESFSFILISLLNNSENDRPDAEDIIEYIEWDSLDKVKKFKKKSIKSSYLKRNDKKDKFIYKKIVLNFSNKQEICEIIIKLKKMAKLNETNVNYLMFMDKYLLIDYRLILIRKYDEEYVNLNDKLNMVKLDESKLINDWLSQILSGLEYLNSKGLVHGNLKCENILFDKNDLIKLTDFGFYHLLEKECEYKSKERCDVYNLGCVLFKCITLEDFSDRKKSIDLLSYSNYSANTKITVINMLSLDVKKRPDLSNLMNTLLNPNYSKLLNKDFISIGLNGKVKTFLASNSCFFLITSTHKTAQKDYYIYNCYRVRNKNGTLINEKINLNSRSNSHNQQTINCNCFYKSYMSNRIPPGLIDSPTSLPRVSCTITNDYLIGCNSEFIYLINDCFKCVEYTCLIEILEMKPNISQIRRSHHHSSLINRFNLELDVVSICFDSKSNKLYLIIKIHNQFCLLNIFDLEFVIKKNPANVNDISIGLINQKQNFGNSYHYNISLANTIHIPALDAQDDNLKLMCCNDKFLLISEKNIYIRAFGKNDGRYLFTLTKTDTIVEPNFLEYSSRDIYIPTAMRSEKTEYYEDKNDDLIQDMCLDLKGNLYVAYTNSIRVLDQTCHFLWKHEFNKKFLNGKLSNICLDSKTGLLAIVVQDEKNDNLSKILTVI